MFANCARTISRLRKRIAQSEDWLRNLEVGRQLRDSENAQRNLEIAQIPRLRGTYTEISLLDGCLESVD